MGLFNAKIMQNFKARSLPIFEDSICGKKIQLCRTHVYFWRLDKHVCQMKMFLALLFVVDN